MKTLIKNASVVLPKGTERVNILVHDAVIADVDAPNHVGADNVVDGKGLYLLPGVIDDQVHFREPGLTHKEDIHTASMACAKGGVTTFLEMPNTVPATTNRELLAHKLAIAAEKSIVNYGFYIGATPDNLRELQLATGTPGIKIFIGSSTGDLLIDSQEALERIFAETALPITAHCEDESTVRANAERLKGAHDVAVHSQIRDRAAAVKATRRAIELAKRHRHRFHLLHVSTADEVGLIEDHQRLITAEVCPHHLLLNVNDYACLDTLAQMNPSLKMATDNAALWQALNAGKIQVIATDHSPHTLEEKQRPYPQSPSGMPNVENSLALMLNEVNNGRCTLETIVNAMCDAPARVWDVVGKGRIEVGYDADLVLVDLELEQEISHENQITKCRWNAWNGKRITGWPVRTWVRGHEVFHYGDFDLSRRGQAAQFDHQRGGYWAYG